MRNFLTDAALRPQPKRTGPDDWATPTDLVIPLLPLLPQGPIWEPVPDSGALVHAMEAAGRIVIPTRANFMTLAPPPGARIALGNPLFNKKKEFAERGFAS